MAKTKYDFFIENLHKGFSADIIEEPLEGLVEKIFDKILTIQPIKKGFEFQYDTLAFDIILCGDKRIQEINKEYRQKDSVTDVITFSLFVDDPIKLISEGVINLGEIIISIDTAKRQAQEQNHSLRKELSALLAHGILHLLGFDHQSDMDYNFIIQTQNEVLKSLGE